MNCERELITAAVAATAPLTITKYNKTLDEENIKFWNNIYKRLVSNGKVVHICNVKSTIITLQQTKQQN